MQTLGITMGDVAGIGPEIIAAAWQTIVQKHACNFAVYGNPDVMRRAVALCRKNITITEVSGEYPAGQTRCLNEDTMPVIPCGNSDVADVPPGTVDARAGETAYQAIIRAADDARAGKIAAVVTAPIHKAALNLAGYHYPGHTEILAERCGVKSFAMMLYLGADDNSRQAAGLNYGLAVDHVTLHCAMKTVFEQITIESVLVKARLVNDFMQKIGKRKPKIGVCSLNPHCGEDGLFGREEIEIIRPAVEQGQREGLDIALPCPADTIMLDAKNGKYDAVVAMFHDQGHIALKLLGMFRAVNVTLGLPIVRTSPAHGTAFDIAWKNGTANPSGFIEAVNVAVKLAQR